MINERLFPINANLGFYPPLLGDREASKSRFGRRRFVALCAGIVSLLRHRQQLHIELELEGPKQLISTPTQFVGDNRFQLTQIGIAQAEHVEQGRLGAIAPRPVRMLARLGPLLRGAVGHLGEAGQVSTFAVHRLDTKRAGSPSRWRYKMAVDGETCWPTAPRVPRIAPEPPLLTSLQPTLKSNAA